jgi:hypothetical protein
MTAVLASFRGFSVRLLAVFACFILAACYPTTQVPIGSTGPTTPDTRLIGSWLGQIGDGPETIYLFFMPRGTDQAEALLVEPAQGQEDGSWSSYTVLNGYAGTHAVLNARAVLDDGKPAESADEGYTPLLYRFEEDGSLHLFLLDESATKAAIRSGKIAGTIKEESYTDSITLTADGKTLDTFFATPEGIALFAKPFGVFRRIG